MKKVALFGAIGLVALIGGCVIVAVVGLSAVEDAVEESANRTESGVTSATSTATTVPTPEPASIGNGSFEVGVDVQPGRYRSAGPEDPYPLCSYARLKTAGASYTDLDEVIEIQNVAGQALVNIQASDGGFFSQGCQTWYLRG